MLFRFFQQRVTILAMDLVTLVILVMVCAMLFIGCTKAVNYSQYSFTDTAWTRDAEQDIETIQNKMWEEYETTPNTAKNYAEVTNGTAKEVEGLKTEIRNLGPINVNAIDEFKALKDRYDFLNTQKTDLEESEKALNKIIEDMIDLMKIQFAEQFARGL